MAGTHRQAAGVRATSPVDHCGLRGIEETEVLRSVRVVDPYEIAQLLCEPDRDSSLMLERRVARTFAVAPPHGHDAVRALEGFGRSDPGATGGCR